MHTRFHAFLQSNRRFYVAVSVLFVLLVGIIVGYEAYTVTRLVDIMHKNFENDAYMFYLNRTLELRDLVMDTFAGHVQAVNAAPVANATTEALQTVVDNLAALPGVRHAYCLENGYNLVVSAGTVPPPGFADTLSNHRTLFGTYWSGAKRFSTKFHNMPFSRVRFHDVPLPGDTLRMILGAFDSTGAELRMLPEVRWNPSALRYLVALDLDPQYIREAIGAHMRDVFHARWSFILCSPPPYDSTALRLNGLGVMAFGDTVWWEGLKTVPHPEVQFSIVHTDPATDMPWASYTTVYRTDAPGDMKLRAAYLHKIYWVLGAIALVAVGCALLLIYGLIVIRKQWLARQTALSHLAHSLRTPVARLRLDVDTLLEERTVSPVQEKEVAAAIGIECGRIERAVHNAALSLEESNHVLRRAPADFSDLVLTTLQPWHASFQAAKVTLNAPQNPPALPGSFDRERITTLLDNLLDNALRHTRLHHAHGGGMVRVTLGADNNTAVLTVEDNGPGVPDADRARIFRRFDRGASTALTGASGLGLGLALVKEIAAAHAGRVSVDASPLGGARFRVELPFASQSLSARSGRGAHSAHRG